MVRSKDDSYYIEKVRNDLEFIVDHMNNTSLEELCNNDILLDSMMFRMIQISENAKNLSEPFKVSKKDIPWNAIYGFRNRIVHDYGHVDLQIIYKTLKDDIPELLKILSK